MRVIEVVGSLALGGAERVALEVAAGVVERGIDAELLCVGPQGDGAGNYERALENEARRRGVAVCRVLMRSLTDRAGRCALADFLRARSPDLVHVHNRPQDVQVVALSRLLGLRATYTIHLPYEVTRARVRALRAACAAAVPVVVCVSNAVARHVSRSEFVPASKIRVIHNGVRTEVFRPATAFDRARMRSELGWGPTDFIFLCAARLSDQKGHKYLLEAVAQLPPGSRGRLALAGDGPLRPDLEAQAARLGLSARVQFLGTREDVPALLGAADAYACASRQEGHPLALLEAMTVGLPIVAPRLPSIVEIAFPGSPVFFGPDLPGWADHHDSAAMAEALAALERESDMHRRKAEGIRAEVTQRFSLDTMVEAHAALYRDLAQRPSRSWGTGLVQRMAAGWLS